MGVMAGRRTHAWMVVAAFGLGGAACSTVLGFEEVHLDSDAGNAPDSESSARGTDARSTGSETNHDGDAPDLDAGVGPTKDSAAPDSSKDGAASGGSDATVACDASPVYKCGDRCVNSCGACPDNHIPCYGICLDHFC
jgi:hypothetical protein